METILDYLRKYGKYTLEEKPFNEVDSLILSQFSYLKLDKMAPGLDLPNRRIGLEQITEHRDFYSIFADERYRKDNEILYNEFVQSKRFRNTKICNYVNRINLDQESQFSAMTYILPDKTAYVAYRGTDETLVGWKEDLNLAFSSPIPGQKMSVKYLEYVAEYIEGSFYVGGHSKGGNLSVYAAMNCDKRVRDRILLIYDHDGPGFRPEVKQESAYEAIKARIQKTVPHSSLVGMLLYNDETYKVVESKSFGIAQHDPFSWIVKEDRFEVVDEIYEGRRLVDDTLNQWILSLNQEQLHAFIDTIYQVIMASETDNLIDLANNKKQSLQKITTALTRIDPSNAKMMMRILKKLFEMLSENAVVMVKEKTLVEKSKIDELMLQLEQYFKK